MGIIPIGIKIELQVQRVIKIIRPVYFAEINYNIARCYYVNNTWFSIYNHNKHIPNFQFF